MPTSRQQILAYIRKRQTASAADISRAMQMTPANARHHLAHLEANGLIEVFATRREGRGRPMQIYALSRLARGDNLEHLASALLEGWLENLSPRQQEAALCGIAQRLAGEQIPGGSKSGDPPAPITRLLALAMERLNELHYQARWEASAGGPRIILGHCPYAGIIEAHPELCQMDAYLLEEWCGSHVQHAAKLQVSDTGLPFCEFLFSE
jgi:predicted ArsR family transcriptional regulator